MTRSQSGKKTLRVSDVLFDHGTSIGGLLRRASFLMQLEHHLAGCVDADLSEHLQVAALSDGHLTLVTPAATWATRLRMQAPQIISALHEAGYTDVEHIDIRVAPLVKRPEASRRKKSLSPAAKQALDHMSHIMADDED